MNARMYSDNINYYTRPQMGCNKWQTQYINCDSNLPQTSTALSNGQKCNKRVSTLLETALTFGSATAQKNYQADSSAGTNSLFDLLRSIDLDMMDSTTPNYSLTRKNIQKKNFYAEGEGAVLPLSLQNQKTIVPATYSNPIPVNDNYQRFEWNAHVGGANSFPSSSFYQQQSSNVTPLHHPDLSLKRYQQSNQINYDQVADSLAVSVQTQNNSEYSYYNNFQEKHKNKNGRKFYAYKNILKQQRRSRQTYTAEQTALLEQAFQANEYASKDVRNMLAEGTQLGTKQIKIWFQNRRMKQKKHIAAGLNANHTSPSVSNAQASTLSNTEGQLQLQPVVQHHEGYQNYSFNHQQHQQNFINQVPYTPTKYSYENNDEMANQPYSFLGY